MPRAGILIGCARCSTEKQHLTADPHRTRRSVPEARDSTAASCLDPLWALRRRPGSARP
jgi:hypothetical protein